MPISQLSSVMVTSVCGSISLPLLQVLSENHVSFIACGEKMNPSCELVPIAEHANAAGCLLQQSAWNDDRKTEVWTEVVRAKINTQRSLLRHLAHPCAEELTKYRDGILPGDSSNREGQAARVYFAALFGASFLRHSNDETNYALNYGYTVLQSACTRLIHAHGYHAALGIHHRSQYNRFNLASDVMEPFRPFVDRIVWQNQGRELDREYKRELAALLYEDCLLGGKKMDLQTALEYYILSVLQAMSCEDAPLMKEVGFDPAT